MIVSSFLNRPKKGGARRRPGGRRGSTYLLVLFTALIVSVVGFAAFRQFQLKERTTHLERDWNEAGVLAHSAVEWGLVQISRDYWWRETFLERQDESFSEELPWGRGGLRWRLHDPVDGDLTDDPADPVRLFGRGRVGDSERVYSCWAWPTGQPLDVLRSALHASGQVTVQGVLDVREGPLSTNERLRIDAGPLLGDVEADTIDRPDQVLGSVSSGIPPKTMPKAVLHDVYRSLGSEIPFTEISSSRDGVLQRQLISPLHHPTDETARNANGLYWIKLPPASTLTIRDCRIEGTLLIETSLFCSVRVGPNVVWTPARPDFPALQIYTDQDWWSSVEIECRGELREDLAGVNFNPDTAPYYGTADSDTNDTYQASLRGLIHVIRDVNGTPNSKTVIRAPNKIVGSLLIDGDVELYPDSILVADPRLHAKPPLGYTTVPPPDNLLSNGGWEAGLAHWLPRGGTATLSLDEEAHGGQRCVLVERDTAAHGLHQDVSAQLTAGATFEVGAWVQMTEDAEEVRLLLEVVSEEEGLQRFETVAPVDTEWTRVRGTYNPSWSGELISARWGVVTQSSAQDFRLDDCVLQGDESTLPVNVRAVPGTWRAESVSAAE